MSQKWQEAFDIGGMTPKEVIEKIAATICLLNYQAMEFAHDQQKDEIEKAYQEGYKDGMKEAVTTTTE